MTSKTKLGNLIIPTNLVGQNKVVNEGVYSDNYLSKINLYYDLDVILGNHKSGILEADPKDLDFFTMNAPVDDDCAKKVLQQTLYTSAHAKKWATYNLHHNNPKSVLKGFEKGEFFESDISKTFHLMGLYHAKESGLVFLTDLKLKCGKKFILAIPSQTFIEYCATKK